jgi:hypothetical protein
MRRSAMLLVGLALAVAGDDEVLSLHFRCT